MEYKLKPILKEAEQNYEYLMKILLEIKMENTI
jgi:hypothetical protein